MALDRHNERPGEGVSQMVARKQYNRAIDVLRTRLAQRRPDPKTRLRLADLLVQAGRGPEAIPILLALADDFGNDGFVAKAVAVLKRVERIRPNLAEVNQRLDRLALQRERALAVPSSVLEPEQSQTPPAPGRAAAPVTPTPLPPPADAETQDPAAPNETVVLRIRGLLGRLLGGRAESPAPRSGSPEATRPGPPPQPEGGAELDASAFLPRSFTPIPSSPAIPAEPKSPSEEPGGPSVAVPPAETEATPEVAAAPAAPAEPPTPGPPTAEVQAQAAEPEAPLAEPALPQPTEPAAALAAPSVADEPAPEGRAPEAGGFRSFLGRLWGKKREEAASEPVWTVFPAAEPPSPVDAQAQVIPDAPPRELAPEVETSAPGVASETATPAAPLETAASEPTAPAPEPVAEALPMVEPDPAPEQVAAPAEPALSEADFHERLLDVVQEALVRQSPEATEPLPTGAAIDTRRLHGSPLLVELDDDELRQLVRDLQLRTCEAGDIVLTEGEPGETLFLLVSGTVKVFVRNPKSRNVEVRELGEGDFFGEVGFLSGRPRMATVVAASPLELLELERPALERLAQAHPGMLDMLEAYYLVRTQSDAAATLRSAAIDDPDLPRRAAEVLKAHFGEAHWDPRMRLKLAEALLKSGKEQDALPILAGLADELVRAGYTEKAVAILKRIERIEGRHTEQISLAPLKRAATPAPSAPSAAPGPPRAEGEGAFNGWLLELVRKSVERGETQRRPGTAPGLLMSPLFEDFSEEELLSLVRGLRLLEYGAGDVLIGEGEDGNSVFVLTSGVVKVFVRNALGHNVLVGRLGEGDFFGEISLLSGRPRSATITAASACELLELDKPTLERMCAEYPRVRSVMEEIYIERASHPLAARVRASTSPAASQ